MIETEPRSHKISSARAIQKDLRFAIIGCGLAGKKRSAALPDQALRIACDHALSRAKEIAQRHHGTRATANTEEAILDPGVQAVIVSTPHSALAPLTLMAVRAGKHVLVEKPGEISSADLKKIQAAANETSALVRIGVNHRYHPAFQKAYELVRSEALGPLMFIRASYGHGGRVGFDREWRADPDMSGGGERGKSAGGHPVCARRANKVACPARVWSFKAVREVSGMKLHD